MKKLLLSLLSLVFLTYSFGQTIPKNKGFVSDYENLFTSAQYAELAKILTDYESQTSIEIAVLTVKDYESDIADFTQKTATEWGIGKKDINNGLLIVLSKNKKFLRTETGYGLEGYLPDGWLKLQGDSIVQKYFKNELVTSTKEDTIDVLNKAKDVFNTSKSWIDQNVTDPELRKTLNEVGVIQKEYEKVQISNFDTTSRYYEGVKAYVLACMSKIGNEYSKDKNSNLIKENKKSEKEENIISWLLENVPWYVWVIIVGLWIILFIFEPGLAIQILFLGLSGGKGGSGFGGGRFGGGGSSSRW